MQIIFHIWEDVHMSPSFIVVMKSKPFYLINHVFYGTIFKLFNKLIKII
jgi:hypothetical protein